VIAVGSLHLELYFK